MKLAPQEDWKDKYLRSVAELDNFRKRTTQEKAMISDNAKVEIITELLPIFDSISSAVGMGSKEIEPINAQLQEIFTKLGVQEIETIDKEFNPNLHNAIMHAEDSSKGKNLVTEELQKGYIMGDRVIRHSLVKVVN